MSLKKHIRAKYIKGCIGGSAKDWPEEKWPQIAFLGRSNVGKSSLINHLTQTKIARTSATPGKTDLINFIAINDEVYFVDLPGYGFAKRGGEIRKTWAESIDHYLHKSPHLKLCLLLLDIRHAPSEQDLAMIDWLLHTGKKFHIVWTKSDKVSQGGIPKLLREYLANFELSLPSTVYSIENPKGRLELINIIEESLRHDGTTF